MQCLVRLAQGVFLSIFIGVLLFITLRTTVARTGGGNIEPQEFVGKVVGSSDRLKLGHRAEIVAYGFNDLRGLAYDPANKQVMIADGSRQRLLSYSVGRERLEIPAWENHLDDCPDGGCEEPDLRGLGIFKDRLYIAEHGHGRVASDNIAANGSSDRKGGYSTEVSSKLGGPSAIALDDDGITAFVTDDRPWPSQSTSGDSFNHQADFDRGLLRPFGSVYQVSLQDGRIVSVIGAHLPHPNGIALSIDRKTLYVATCDGHETAWATFRRATPNSTQWEKGAILASVKAIDSEPPPFRGIVSDASGNIFAAGPNGIHIFDSTGFGLGRIELHGRVSGLAWVTDGAKRWLYFGESHALCRIRVKT